MSIIERQDSNGVKPLLQVGELGYDNYPAGGDKGRVYVGTGTENIGLAKKTEVVVVDGKADAHIARVDNPHNVTKAQVGLGNVEDLAPADMPISSVVQAALNAKANKTDADLLGVPKAPTATVGTDTTQLATTAFVRAEVASEAYSKAELDAGQLDNRYYTETELLNGSLDVRYFTETELLNGSLDVRYYTEAELDAGQLDSRYYTQTQVDNLLDAQNDASEISYDNTVSGIVATNVQDAVDEIKGSVDILDSTVVKLTGDQTIAGIKTFSSSPIVPTPTTGTQAVNKTYADTKVAKVASTDKAIVRFNGTTGEVQNSNVIIDDYGNVGIGVTPIASDSTTHGIQTEYTYMGSRGGSSQIMFNAVPSGNATDKYVYSSTVANAYEQNPSGQHIWKTAPSDTAGNGITWTNAMTLGANGNLLVGTSTDNGVDKLQVNGNISYKTKSGRIAGVSLANAYITDTNSHTLTIVGADNPLMLEIVNPNSGVTCIPIYPFGGSGTKYIWNVLNPATGAFVNNIDTYNISLTVTDRGLYPNTYTITLNGNTSNISIQATTLNTGFNVYITIM